MVMLPADLPYTRDPFRRENHHVYEKLVLPDLDYLIYKRFAQTRMLRKYGFSPLDFKGFYQFLMEHKEDIVVVAHEDRVRLYEYYYKAVYGYPLCLNEVSASSPSGDKKLYAICR